ncbi:hypothetical protein [Actinacidiphila rubida]|uniref:Secreted protein n=1 Tax=Actinacidiphila rubida TaxID=310780 RepID=A0A1H8I0A3_9ACTN|nr:hypothetical protein [Actinacidiphila rubida]SEN61767.1 hypothetical protein SAMN05216267_1007140 [Actinacidiphila rubida]
MSTTHLLRERLAALRGPATSPRPLDARALAALAANPGCRRRAVLDAAGVDKGAVAGVLGAPAPFGQSRFAFSRGHAFEARVKADDCGELLRLLGAEGPAHVPDLTAAGPEGRAARTRLALAEAPPGAWTLLDHPLLALEVAGSTAYLEPDAVAVAPDGGWTVVEIKSFPILDGAADPQKVGAAARQSAVYVLALDAVTPGRARRSVLLVCPRNFSNQPAAEWLDVRKQAAVTRRQLARLTRIEEITATLPEGTTFDLVRNADGDATRPAGELASAVDAVPAAYAPECLSTCELAFHCRARALAAQDVAALGRSLRGDLGELTTVEAVLTAAAGTAGDPADPAVVALRRAAALRSEALAHAAKEAAAPSFAPADAAPSSGRPAIPGQPAVTDRPATAAAPAAAEARGAENVKGAKGVKGAEGAEGGDRR